ncbi:tetratricopeptide repeat protein [bacterium]|nr:tetratricopeptide repeat protein [bacterium]
MKNKLFACLLGLAVCLPIGLVFGQESNTTELVPTERRLMMYRVRGVYPGEQGILAYILESSKDGLFDGSTGVVRSVFNNGGREGSAADELGRAQAFEVTDSLSWIAVVLTDSSTTDGYLYENDVVELATDIPILDYRSVFFDFVRNSVEFYDNFDQPIFNRGQILQSDSPELEIELETVMAEQVRETGADIRPQIPDNPQWDLLIEGGRFAGMKLVDALESTTYENIHAFLGFVTSYPGKYLGGTWKINETYATWLINAAPPGQVELRDMLLAAMDTPAFDSLLAEYSDELTDGIFTSNWNNQAEALGDENKLEEAIALSDVVALVASHLGDNNMYGYMLFSRADIAASAEELDTAVNLYQKAIQAFEETNDIAGKGMAVNNLGNKLNDLDRYAEADSLFNEAISLKLRLMQEDTDNNLRASLASSSYGKGTSLLNLGQLEDAIASFQTADSLYVLEGSLSSQRSHTYTLNQIGKAFLKSDKYDKAIEQYRLSFDASQAMGDDEGKADALDEMGYAHSVQGKDQDALDAFERAYDLHVLSGNLKDAGYSKSQSGQSLWRLKRFDEAIVAHHAAIAIREQAGFVSGQAYSWLKLGDLYKEAGDPLNAISAFDTASSLYDQVGNRSGAADVLETLGDMYISVEDYAKAAQTHLKALEIRQELLLAFETATSLNDVAGAYFSDRKFDEAKKYYEQSAELRRELRDYSGLIKALANLGNISHFHDRDYEKAQSLYAEAIDLAKLQESSYDLAYCYRGLGNIEEDTGNSVAALEHYTEALNLFSDTDDLVNTHLRRGSVFLVLGRFDESRSEYEAAKTLAEEANSRLDVASALNSLGGLEVTIGQPTKALQLGMQSLRIAEDVSNPWGMASANVIIGNAYNVMGTNQLAVTHYSIADSLWASTDSDLARATPINNTGTIYYHQGDYAGSLPFFEEAYRIQKEAKIEDNFTAILLGNIGASYMKMGQFELGDKWLLDGQALSDKIGVEPSRSSMRVLLGESLFRQQKPEQALEMLLSSKEIAQRIGDPGNLASAELWLGKLYDSMGSYEDAIASLNESARISREVADTRTLWQTLDALGNVYQHLGQKEEAIQSFTQSTITIEQLSGRLAFGDSAKELYSKSDGRSEVYEKLIRLLVEEGKIELALSYIERSNNEALRKSLASLQIEFADPEKTTALQQEREQKAELEAIDKQISVQKSKSSQDRQADLIESLERKRNIAEQDYVRFVNQTIRSFPELAVHLSDSVNPKDLSKVKGNIPENTAVVAYLVGNSGTFIFVANTDTVIAVAVDIVASDVNLLVNEVHSGLKAPGSGLTRKAGSAAGRRDPKIDIQAALTDLYRLLVEPIEDAIAGKEMIAVIPSGSLHKLPFQVLSDPENGKKALVDEHTIYYTSNLGIFSNENIKQELRIVAFGNADESLEWSEREVTEIADIKPDTQVFLREEATESRVKNVSTDFNVLHLATHGTLDYNDFENSFLTLAKGDSNSEDGHLTIAEIWSIVGLDSYRLVTLSACETAVNDDISNGWPISPANAFLEHVPSVIASLWEVDDVATSILMQRFYQNLETMGTAKALQLAQLSLSSEESYSDPFYWAPFVVMGDWR